MQTDSRYFNLPTAIVSEGNRSRWDLSSVFPSLQSSAYESYVGEFERGIEALQAGLSAPTAADVAGRALQARQLLDLETLELRQQQLSSYLACLRAEGSSDPAIAPAQTRLQRLGGMLTSARASLLQQLGALGDVEFEDFAASPQLAGATHRIRLLRDEARRTLCAREEKLAAELDIDGRRRWARLAADTISQTVFELETSPGVVEKVTMSRRFELAWDPRPQVRRAAFDAINKAFAPLAPLLAGCFNAMAGTGITLAQWRGIDPIEEPMVDNWIFPSTVYVMQGVLKAHAPVLQEYLRRKARLLGHPALGIYDRSAPLDVPELTADTIDEAAARVVAAFGKYCSPLADYARRAFERRWVESEMRAGKQPGGFCAYFPEPHEVRIFLSFGGSFNSIAVLAHELGHAFHAHQNFSRRFWQQGAPSALSETASILCEHLLRRAVFTADAAEAGPRLGALTAQLDSAVNYLLRIPRDFDFEVEFYRERSRGEVGPERLCELMRRAHVAWFGNALKGDNGDGLAWAYNHLLMEPRYRLYTYPYSFGYLLSSRIADAFEEQGDAFTPNYVAFLQASATSPLEEAVLSSLGFDVTKEAFWETCLIGIRRQLDLLAKLGA